jgi:hypothetical protein
MARKPRDNMARKPKDNILDFLIDDNHSIKNLFQQLDYIKKQIDKSAEIQNDDSDDEDGDDDTEEDDTEGFEADLDINDILPKQNIDHLKQYHFANAKKSFVDVFRPSTPNQKRYKYKMTTMIYCESFQSKRS